MKIRPLNNIVLARPIKEEMSKSGIVLPDKETGRFIKLKVLAVGNLVEVIKPGDIVYANALFEKVSEDVGFINSKDILAIIEK